MKDKQYLFEKYGDLLDEDTDSDVFRLVADLDALSIRGAQYPVEATEQVLLEHAGRSHVGARARQWPWHQIMSAVRNSAWVTTLSRSTDSGRRGVIAPNRQGKLLTAILVTGTVFVLTIAVVTLTQLANPHSHPSYLAHSTPAVRHVVPTRAVRVLPPVGPLRGLYVTEDVAASPGTILVPVDPSTLARDTSRKVVPLVPGAGSYVSSDGRAIVQIFEDTDHARTVDASTGRMLAGLRLPAPNDPYAPAFLSPDGSRLVFMRDDSSVSADRSTWYVVDALTGRTLATVPTIRVTTGTAVLVNRATTRLYLVSEGSGDFSDAGPTVPVIEEYDLASGRRIAQAELRGVLAGSWHTGRRFRGLPVFEQLTPGVALSPDGTTIAMVRADSDGVVLLNAHTLGPERTLRFDIRYRQQSPFGRHGELTHLGGPSGGVVRQATFSPDGRMLYVTGYEVRYVAVPRNRRDPRGEGNARAAELHVGLGLAAVDLRTGRTTASQTPVGGANEVARYSHLQPSPDGRSLYASVCASQVFYTPSGAGERCRLERLDSRTLVMEAQRKLNDEGEIFFYGGVSSGRGR